MTTPTPWRGRLLVLAGIALAAFNLRTAITSLTPLLELVGGELGFGSLAAGVLGMLPTAAFAVLGIATPAVVHRLGLERTVVLAMGLAAAGLDRKSTRLNSSHVKISYAVFCLKKKKEKTASTVW